MSDSSDIRGMEGEIPSSIAWYSLSIEKIIEKFNTDVENGLSSPEASSRLRRYGPNKLREVKGVPTWIILLNQFKSLIVVLLLIATGIALFLGDNIEALAVFMVIILNAAFGFFTEWRAEKSMQSLKNLVVPKARVVRDGDVDEILATDLVPGDIILLEAGDRVPADGRLVEAVDLSLQEAALTGESLSVRKDPEVVVGENTPLGDRVNMVYMSMIVTEGRGKAIVVKTGMKTEVGQISGMIEGAGEEMTPLERRLERLGRYLVILCFGISVIIIIAGILRGLPSIDMLRTGLSLAIAAVPEGLPVVATITLAIGMRRMARRNAIIRRLPAVETLGCTTTICTDKTGTLTENELMVREIYLHPDTIKVTGEGYVPEGTFDLEGKKARKDERLRMALKIAALCNNAALDEEVETGGVSWDVIGDPTEGALLVAAEKIGYQPKELRKEYPRLDELPFDSDKKIMATLHEVRDGENPSSSTHRLLGVKGALEVILDSCDYVYKGTEIILLTDEDREAISVQADEMAKRALRVLTVAYKELPVSQDSVEDNDIQGLTFLGLMGMTDSPRPEAEGAIEECQTAGIKVIMITGDNKITAEVIAKELGLASDDSLILDYSEIDFKDREELKEIVKKVTVYSRVSPADKLNIVDALQENGEIVAMTGDGVNDAPALKTADIGISMGQTGTDVAQEASDMVLADDNFATIVAAVEEGRVIYANI